MSKVVYKFNIGSTDTHPNAVVDISIPERHKMLHIDIQRRTAGRYLGGTTEQICVWYEVEMDDRNMLPPYDENISAELSEFPRLVTERFHFIPTGSLVPEGVDYLATVLLLGGAYVLHIYKGHAE